ncbi:hypothetical protein B0H11DRAFT_1935653 [Mycena galericulata]|nr:hypothetical protein B0H11DRAFT_1935653 [Mycena galericulata]
MRRGRFASFRAIARGGGRAEWYSDVRERDTTGYAFRWCTKLETKAALEGFGDTFLKTARRDETDPPRPFANNLRPGMDMKELCGELGIQRRLPGVLDACIPEIMGLLGGSPTRAYLTCPTPDYCRWHSN